MITIGLSARTLANTRFVVSPLSSLITGLFFAYCPVQTGGLGLSARIQDRLRRRELAVLGALFAGGWNYLPDFIHPHPTAYLESLDRELHAVASVRPARLAEELDLMLGDGSADRVRAAAVPRVLLEALEKGEQ